MSEITAEQAQQKHPGTGHHLLRVKVEAPNAPKPKIFEWAPSTKVAAAAQEAAQAFGYQAQAPGFQTSATPPRQLDNEKTLEQEHVESGDTLELVDIGGGV